MSACEAVGALMVGGRIVGQVTCDLDAGHELGLPPTAIGEVYIPSTPGTPHAMTLTWAPEIDGPDLDLFDPAERFDVDVPIDEPRCSTCGGALVFFEVSHPAIGEDAELVVHRDSTPTTRSHPARR